MNEVLQQLTSLGIWRGGGSPGIQPERSLVKTRWSGLSGWGDGEGGQRCSYGEEGSTGGSWAAKRIKKKEWWQLKQRWLKKTWKMLSNHKGGSRLDLWKNLMMLWTAITTKYKTGEMSKKNFSWRHVIYLQMQHFPSAAPLFCPIERVLTINIPL